MRSVDRTNAALPRQQDDETDRGRRGTGRHVTPLRVDFTRPDPKTGDHAAWFGCEIRWGAPRNVLILKSEDLDRSFPGHNPELLEILTPALADVARDLGLSERTLQRRITEEGKTFRDLLVEARQELGRRLLADPTAEIEEVACLLGYQDTSSFYRAFRDWEGVTPNRWRELNAASIPRGDLDHAVHRGEPAPGVHIHHDDELERLAA